MSVRLISLMVVLSTAACEPPLPARGLPPLQTQRRPAVAPNLRVLWFPGEKLVWQVHSKTMQVGTAVLATQGTPPRVRSQFLPERWLRAVRALHHDLVTSGQPVRDVHTLHSLLGWLRAWSHPDNRPALVQARFGKQRYRVEVSTPSLEAGDYGRLRVELIAHANDDERIEASLWLTNDSKRSPVRIDIRLGARRITATLITDR
ncbi:MAG: hypothetical protein KJO07_05000 [Deltaproteobacteria bacterium]|jgi:hypothetical protein|nr:hypothetical protein [Deltaproteobacteria bacterium]